MIRTGLTQTPEGQRQAAERSLKEIELESKMNKQNLIAALEAEVTRDGRGPEEIIFIRLLKEVWEIDWTVAPYDVWTNMIEWNVPYFRRFMGADVGDEAQENQLIIEWITSRIALEGREQGSNWKRRVLDLIEDMNRLRATIEQQSR